MRARFSRWPLRRLSLLTLNLLFVAFLAATVARAQGAPADDLTIEAIDAKIKAAQADAGLDAELKAKLLAAYGATKRLLEQADTARKQAAAFERARTEAPEKLLTAKAAMAAKPVVERPSPAPNTPLPELEARLGETTQTAREAQKRVTDLGSEADRRKKRLPLIPTELAQKKSALQDVETVLAAPPDKDVPERLAPALRMRLRAEKAALTAAIDGLEKESAAHTATAELATVEQDLATRAAAAAENLRLEWQSVVQARRRARAEATKRDAEASATRVTHPELQVLANENAAYARELPSLASNIERAQRALERAKAKLSELDARLGKMNQLVELVGLSDEVGSILRRENGWLRTTRRDVRSFMRARRDDVTKFRIRQYELERERKRLTDLDAAAAASVPADVDEQKRPAMEAEARALLARRRGYIDSTFREGSAYLKLLSEIKAVEDSVATKLDDYLGFINERILWIRSAPPMWATGGFPDVDRVRDWLLDPAHWGAVAVTLREDAAQYWLVYLAVGLALIALVLARRRIRTGIDRSGAIAAEPTCTNFGVTVSTLAYTLLLAAPWPSLLLLLGWRLGAQPPASDAPSVFVATVGTALAVTGQLGFGLEILRQTCRPNGLCRAHFGLAPAAVETVQRNVTRLMMVVLPLEAVVEICEGALDLSTIDAMGRAAYVMTVLAVAWFAGAIFHPTRGVLTHGLRERTLFRRGVFVALMALFLGVAILAIVGYYVTALRLGGRIAPTLIIIALLTLFYWITMRGLRLSRRRLLLREEGTPDAEGLQDSSKKQRFEEAALQNRKLVASVATVAGLVATWQIWADVLPALGFLRSFELWSVSDMVDGKPVTTPVTIIDMIIAALLLLFTITAARSLPGLLRITLLQRMPEGDRLALAKVVQYGIVAAGLIAVLSAVRLQWQHMQWAVAGLSVGLGFGLQEIFANFMSGLIILFERPIRVGDMVTVGQTQGRVSEVRVRSTTILDFDMRELIVPNKDFITKEVVNWTLSSPVTRAVIPVSVSIESDADKARELLTKVAAENPLVLDDPKPWAMFHAFGENKLQLKLMVYLATRDDWFPVVDRMHSDILREFRQAGVEFALDRADIRVQGVGERDAAEMLTGEHGRVETPR